MNRLSKGILITGSILAIGTGLVACKHGDSPDEHAAYIEKKITKELELDNAQQEKLHALKQVFMTARNTLHKNKDGLHQAVETLLNQDTLDRQKVLSMITMHTDNMKQQAPPVVEALGNFYDSLTSEQRKELHEHIQDRMEQGRHRHHW